MAENVEFKEPPGGRWVLVILGMIINLCLGSVYSWSVFVKPLTDHFQAMGQVVSANDVLLPFSIFLAVFAIAMPLSGKYIEKYGPRKVTMVGGVLCGLGWLLASTASSVQMLYPTYGIIGGLGVGIAYGCPVAVAARWFPDRRGLAVGLTVLGFGFSAFFTANIAGYLIAAQGVMNTFRVFGVAFIIIIVLLSMPLVFPPAGYKPPGWTPPAPKPGAAVTHEFRREEMLKTPTFYGLWLCYFIGCLAGLMAISVSKPVGTEIVQIDPELATFLVGFFAIFNGGGRPLFGYLTDKLTPRNAAIVSFVLIFIACMMMATMAKPTASEIYVVAFAALWLCLGGWLAIAPTSTATFFGTTDYPRNYGVVFLAYGAGAIVGPQLAGFIKTSTGSYMGVFNYVAALAIIGIIIAYVLMRPPKKPE
ncbi:MAG: OFA family MFS transporter [Methanothrix sp.]|uniref:Major facilitator superfamily MFS_1 n=1 Tax=Methanothrix thermoacetophila (strain DSM 6194 / JCM 14653 / NBRC 101360 / PT) TaxID=349307 RepID=A0B6I2_METTP|nr:MULTISPECIES: OFA family MFS transporter [Methanothrix]ABK14306.1 major facilitator superfamily MFS_1 [Methanothrix thermoacetophila PT]MBC7080299.1 OFA family MFS transporter [Methanothrix sp.]NPU87668.1 OFA family MFS transporter [Methanothrix sp.]